MRSAPASLARECVAGAGESCLALPKLNLQFLTAHDYLLRNFSLFRLEATYEIREDIADVLGRVGATWCAAPRTVGPMGCVLTLTSAQPSESWWVEACLEPSQARHA